MPDCPEQAHHPQSPSQANPKTQPQSHSQSPTHPPSPKNKPKQSKIKNQVRLALIGLVLLIFKVSGRSSSVLSCACVFASCPWVFPAAAVGGLARCTGGAWFACCWPVWWGLFYFCSLPAQPPIVFNINIIIPYNPIPIKTNQSNPSPLILLPLSKPPFHCSLILEKFPSG